VASAALDTNPSNRPVGISSSKPWLFNPVCKQTLAASSVLQDQCAVAGSQCWTPQSASNTIVFHFAKNSLACKNVKGNCEKAISRAGIV
jgi:hypothetical protein